MNRNYITGKTSARNLSGTRPEVQSLWDEAMKIANTRKMHCPDFGCSSGLRTAQEQVELFKKGRTLIRGSWVITAKSKVVTHKRGTIFDRSSHQSGWAIDIFAIRGGKAD